MAEDKLTAATGAASPEAASAGHDRTGQVSIILAGAIMAGGLLAEAAAPGQVTLLTGADFAVGACYATVGAWLLRTSRRGPGTARSGAAPPAGGPAGGW